jgi:hypothetical protein
VHRIAQKAYLDCESQRLAAFGDGRKTDSKTKKQWNMEHRISTLFYPRKSKKTSHGLAPVYMRITVNGQRLEQSIQRFVDPAQWSAAAGG